MIRGLIGVVHLPAMPGDPLHSGGGFEHVEREALRDAEALATGGADAIILENFGSVPFAKGVGQERIPPHQIAILSVLARRIIETSGLPVGINCLRNDAMSAVGIAAATGATFVRVNVHTGAYLTDQGVIEGDAHGTLRYRAALGASNVKLLADVFVKHAVPLASFDVKEAVADAFDRGLADGVICTGRHTGGPADLSQLVEMRKAAGPRPLYVGSGLTPQNCEQIGPLVDGAIVGTWLKEGGNLKAAVDPSRVREMVAALRSNLRKAP